MTSFQITCLVCLCCLCGYVCGCSSIPLTQGTRPATIILPIGSLKGSICQKFRTGTASRNKPRVAATLNCVSSSRVSVQNLLCWNLAELANAIISWRDRENLDENQICTKPLTETSPIASCLLLSVLIARDHFMYQRSPLLPVSRQP